MSSDLLTKISEQLADGVSIDWAAARLALSPELVSQLQQIQALAAGFEGLRPGSERPLANADVANCERLAARYLPILKQWAQTRFPSSIGASAQAHDLVTKTLLVTLDCLPPMLEEHEGALLIYLRAELLKAFALQQLSDDGIHEPNNAGLSAPLALDDCADYEGALQKLSPIQREAIILKFEFGMNFAEIAAALERPNAQVVQSLLARALVAMAPTLGEN